MRRSTMWSGGPTTKPEVRPGSYYRTVVTHYLGVGAGEGWTLDLGAGDGRLLAGLDRPNAVALDPRPVAMRGLRVVRGDGTAAPFSTASFTTVLAFDVLEHVDDDAGLVRELFRLVSPGGTIWVSIPSRDFALFPSWLTAPVHRAWGHVRPGYTRTQLLALLPPGHDVTVLPWNEPAYRLCYPAVRVLSAISPPLARRLIRLIACFDSTRRQGDRGHFFCRVRLLTQ